MSDPRCYLDFNATAPLRTSVRAACTAALDMVGNPSSIHREGREARQAIESARRDVGTLVGASADRVVFTSGGTEAAHLLLSPAMHRANHIGASRLIVSAVEHAAVLLGHGFPNDRVAIAPVDPDGVVDLDALSALIKADSGPALVALQAANNETGVLQPVRAVADLVHASGGLLISDAVQAIGKLPFAMADSGADGILLSAHKLGGPKGSGAAILADQVVIDTAQLRGGGQERGLRSGTENLVGIVGLGAAAVAVLADRDEPARLAALQARLEAGIRSCCAEAVIFGAAVPRLPNTTCFAVPGFQAETLLMAFDLEGVAVSSGSACSSGKVSRSHVLDAMGVTPHLSHAALRISLGWSSTAAHVDRCLDVLWGIMQRMHRRSVSAAA